MVFFVLCDNNRIYVEVVNICGEERLLYKAIHVDVALIRATYADEYGNITMEHECCTAEATAIAQAAKNCGGKVIVQVEKVVTDVDPKLVKVPGIYVDAVVISFNFPPSTRGSANV